MQTFLLRDTVALVAVDAKNICQEKLAYVLADGAARKNTPIT